MYAYNNIHLHVDFISFAFNENKTCSVMETEWKQVLQLTSNA